MITLHNPEVRLTREYLMRERDAYLAIVDNIERILEVTPRTAELRRAEKLERFTVLSDKKLDVITKE